MEYHISSVALTFICVSMTQAQTVTGDLPEHYKEIVSYLEGIHATQTRILERQDEIMAKLNDDNDDTWFLFRGETVRSFIFYALLTFACIVIARLYLQKQMGQFVDSYPVKKFILEVQQIWSSDQMTWVRAKGRTLSSNFMRSSRDIIIHLLEEPAARWVFEQIAKLREDNFFQVVGQFVGKLLSGGVSPSNLVTIATAVAYNVARDVKESAQDAVLRVSYNYWEQHSGERLTWEQLFKEFVDDPWLHGLRKTDLEKRFPEPEDLKHVDAEAFDDKLIRFHGEKMRQYLEKAVVIAKAHGDRRFMFNGLSEDRNTEQVFGSALSSIDTLALSQMTTSEAPFVKLTKDQVREVFPKIGALVSNMNYGELLKASVSPNLSNNFHTFVLGLCFESAPQGAKKFRLMIMEETQLRMCLDEDDPEKYNEIQYDEHLKAMLKALARPPNGEDKLMTKDYQEITYADLMALEEADMQSKFPIRMKQEYPERQLRHGGPKTSGCATPLPHQREDRLRVMRIMANLWFNSNGGEDVKMKAGDMGLRTFKLSRLDLKLWVERTVANEKRTTPQLTSAHLAASIDAEEFHENSSDLAVFLEAFFNDRADKYYSKEEGPKGLLEFVAKNIETSFPIVPNFDSSKALQGEALKEWKYNNFLSRLVIIDTDGGCHKLHEKAEREFDWVALANWLEGKVDMGLRRRFNGKWKRNSQGDFVEAGQQYPIMARLTPVKRGERKNELLTRSHSETRGCRGLTSVDLYGLADNYMFANTKSFASMTRTP